MPNKKLVFSTGTSGSGEIALSNKRFNNKVKSCVPLTKGEQARQKLEALFNK